MEKFRNDRKGELMIYKKLSDYKWLSNKFRIKKAIEGWDYTVLSKRDLLAGFLTTLIGTTLIGMNEFVRNN